MLWTLKDCYLSLSQFPPFAALLQVFKDYEYPPEIENCPAKINDKQSCKTKV